MRAAHVSPGRITPVMRGRTLLRPALFLFTATLALLVGACSTSSPNGPISTEYEVSLPETQFYKFGPSQASGPDALLHLGQHVTMISKEFGFSRVMLSDGVSGYVSTDRVKPAPPPPATPKPKPLPPVTSGVPLKRKPASDFKPSPDPLFDVNDVPPPPLPNSSEKPTFRY